MRETQAHKCYNFMYLVNGTISHCRIAQYSTVKLSGLITDPEQIK